MGNYIMLNGKRIDLTAEQIETLVGKKEKDPFERNIGERYFYVSGGGFAQEALDTDYDADCQRFDAANYCTDKELMEQRALHVILNQQLWRYSMQHGGREIDWTDYSKAKYQIYIKDNGAYCVDYVCSTMDIGAVFFITSEIANAAIEEIVKPFMEQHPEFRW